jgi:uncharacterized membrane protein
MVTTRNTYWITLTNALFPTLFIALTLLAQLATQIGKHAALWAATGVTQVITIFVFTFTVESYRNVLYIEEELRPSLAKTLNKGRVLLYEDYLQRQRTLSRWGWEENYTTLAIPLVVVGFATIALAAEWTSLDTCFLIANLLGLYLAVRAAHVVATLRKRLATKAVQDLTLPK